MRSGSIPIDPDFGSETQIRIKQTTKALIEDTKIIPRETLNDVIVRVFNDYRERHRTDGSMVMCQTTTDQKP